ncbi:MAG: hypothetical protein ACRD2C_27780 [Acidimicrobiales bacterium]
MPVNVPTPDGGGATPATSSANPTALLAASQVVQDGLKTRLEDAQFGLHDEIAAFNRLDQSPDLIEADYELASLAYHGVRIGDEIDTHLNRVAAAFFEAGYPVGDALLACDPPVHVMWTIGAGSLDAELARWETVPSSPTTLPPPIEFDGDQVLGPDGEWYTVVTRPPPGSAPWLGTSPVQTFDFGNPDYAMGASARMLLLGAAPDPILRFAPPGAYDYVGWDADGNLVVGQNAADQRPPGLRPPHPTDELYLPDAPPPPPGVPPPYWQPSRGGGAVGGGVDLAQGALAGLGQSAHERYRGVYRTQANFYVDPVSGERVAVVDAAQVYYDADGNVIVQHGRLSFDDPEHPFVPLDVAEPPSDQAAYRAGSQVVIPVEGD